MNRDEILKIAAEAGAFWELSETPEKDMAFLMRVVERATEPLQARIKDLYRQLDEAEKRLDEQYAMGMEAEREACAQLCESRFMGDLNREDMEARRLAAAIRARGEK